MPVDARMFALNNRLETAREIRKKNRTINEKKKVL